MILVLRSKFQLMKVVFFVSEIEKMLAEFQNFPVAAAVRDVRGIDYLVVAHGGVN